MDITAIQYDFLNFFSQKILHTTQYKAFGGGSLACTPGMAKAIASRADFGFINGICWGSLTDYPINQTTGKILDPGMSSKIKYHIIYSVLPPHNIYGPFEPI